MQLKLITPAPLQKGDTIGIVAPSAGNANFFPHRVERAVAYLEEQGYIVVLSKHCMDSIGYVSATPQERAEDINAMFADASIRCIMCTIGGNHSNQLLKYIDFSLVKDNPKIFIGYSDISVLHYAFMSQSQLQTYYGPCVMTQFGEFPEPIDYTIEYFNKALMSRGEIDVAASNEWTSEILDWSQKKDLTRPRHLNPSSGYQWLRKGNATGQIIGGCVPSVNHLLGTQYWLDPQDKIFVIDIPEGHEFGQGLPLSDLDAYLADLDNAGVFRKIRGLVVGRPYNYSDEDMEKLRELLLYYTEDTDYPILLNANIGHADPIITLPLGAEGVLDSNENQFMVHA